MRLALTAQGLGLAIQPLSQVLEEYPDMAQVKQRFEQAIAVPAGRTAQMLVRVGYGGPGPHRPRRDPQVLLRPAG